jgi:hypothetical protein
MGLISLQLLRKRLIDREEISRSGSDHFESGATFRGLHLPRAAARILTRDDRSRSRSRELQATF